MRLEDFLYHDSFRPGQRELASSVYDACVQHRSLVAEAVSGFGKTAAVLSGSLLAASENDLRIMYCCRTKRQIFRVMEEVSAIQRKRGLKAAYLSSKYDYCLLRRSSQQITPESFRWFCSFQTTNNLCSYFLNLNLVPQKVGRLVEQQNRSPMTHASFLKECEAIHVCPYEVARLAVGSADVIGVTYFYAFDEMTRSLLFTASQLEPSKTVLVVDEAHNLKDFIRDLSTSELTISDLDRALSESKGLYLEDSTNAIQTIKERLKDYCAQPGDSFGDKELLLRHLTEGRDASWLPNLSFELSTCARAGWYSVATARSMPESILKVGKFLTKLLASTKLDDMVLTRSKDSVKIISTDPSGLFADATNRFRSRVLLSATIGPSELFLGSLGLDPASTATCTMADYRSLRIRTVIDTGVTTRFKLRTDEMYGKIASKILCAAGASGGSIVAFTPSYTVLKSLAEQIGPRLHDRRLLTESGDLSGQEADEMIRAFQGDRRSILLAVQGGRFSEGEDFREEHTNICFVVGLSLPPPSPELFAEYTYMKNKRDSFIILSLLPALRKAFQAAGRHIRTPTKKGLVFLLDSRFNSQAVLALMPSWLKRDIVMGDFSDEEISTLVKAAESS